MSTTHITKADLQTDAVTMELKKGFQWTQAHHTMTVNIILGFIVAGILFSGWKYMTEKKAITSQEVYFKIEGEYLKKKGKTQGTGMEASTPVLDYEKDLSAIVKKFEGVIESDPSSTAALMAALNIAEIGAQYHKEDVALSALNKAKPSTNILSVLLLNEKATAQANLNDCKSAVETWSKLVNLPQAAAIKGQVLLKQGLCYESLNDNIKAEENYNKVIADSKEGNLAKSAEKYLRLLKSK